jgi:hypothetical protein
MHANTTTTNCSLRETGIFPILVGEFVDWEFSVFMRVGVWTVLDAESEKLNGTNGSRFPQQLIPREVSYGRQAMQFSRIFARI